VTALSRRAFVGGLAGLGASTFGLTLLATARGLVPLQDHKRVPRIGYLTFGPRESRADRIDAFLGGLRDLGYVEGQTIAIEWRFAPDVGGGCELAADLVRLDVDVIVVDGATSIIQACKQATSAIPIVFANTVDPVETGLVASLSRPGGNVTGAASSAPGLREAARFAA
jgi:putative ABC transport system substrate-binding protein